MKKIIAMAVAAGAFLNMSAEGYQVNTFSTKQEGMGHVGVAMKLGAESQIFNPAALSFMNKTMEISGSVSAISSEVTATYQNQQYKTSNKTSTPMNVSAAFRIYDNLYAGITLYTPYGSSINWGRNWPGAALNQSVDLKVFCVQPTFSWRITPKFSIGAGLMIAWGSVDLNKGLVSASSFDQLITLINTLKGSQVPLFGNVSPAYANLTGDSEKAIGFNVGAMYDVSDKVTVGASFRSKLNMHVKAGDVTVGYANDASQLMLEEYLKNLNYTNFDASMPCPYVLTAGVSYKPIETLVLAADVQLNGWGTYDYLDIKFAQQSQFDQHLKKDYHNAMTYHLGAQYTITPRLDLRAGLMIDTSPCNTDYYNPETPGTTKIEPSVGLSFRPIKGLSIDLALMYVNGAKVEGATGQYDDFIAPIYNATLQQANQAMTAMGLPELPLQQLPQIGQFKADYKLHALIPAFGISYSF